MSSRFWPRGTIALAISGVVSLAPSGLVGQLVEDGAGPSSTDGYDHALAPVARAVRLSGPVAVDGVLDEAAWLQAVPIDDFVQTEPLEGRAVTEVTVVRIVYDDDAIYVGARLDDRSGVTTRLARRDSGLGDSDRFLIMFDSYHDHETAYRFWTNPSGVKGDAIVTGNQIGRGDSSWDPVWQVATTVTADGWVAEMRIPFSQLRFSREVEQTWGVQVERFIYRNQESAEFPFTSLLEREGVSRFAHLEGLRGIEPGRRLELLPYVVARGEYLQLESPSGATFDNPYRSGNDHFGGVGLDLKYRLASNVTLDATVNPDFGQVELDPSVINLTAFETRFEERRPFFVEGSDIFNFGERSYGGSTGRPPDIFYSRRIGRPPTGSVPSGAVYADVPTATTILGAAKVTGRVGDGWTLGLMEAATQRETAPFVHASGLDDRVTLEPMTNHLVGRVRRQFRGGATRVGVMGTAVNRDLSNTSLASALHRHAYTAGVDFGHETTDRTWFFAGTVARSHVAGDAAAIDRTQRSSARYFQRPDADHLSLDPTATSLSGTYAVAYVGKEAGSFTMRNNLGYVSPGFEVNDLGFQSEADRVVFDTHYQYNDYEPGRFLRQWSASMSPDAKWNTAGDMVFANVNAQVSLTFLNYWRTSLRMQVDPWTDDDQLTRGGPMARTPSGYNGRFSLNSDGRKAVTARAGYSWRSDAAGQWNRSVSVGLSARVRETLTFSIGPTYRRSRSLSQYVSRVEDSLATSTFGSRYVFADLDRTTLSMDARMNVTFTPTMSLQLYVEPFISVGDYGALKEFAAPGTFDFLEYGAEAGTLTRGSDGSYDIDPDGAGPSPAFRIADRDFSYRSLIGNAVFRWDWRPGSTLYLVWQQRRIHRLAAGDHPRVGRFDLWQDADDMFGVKPDNILMIKVNYWLNP